MCDQPRFMPERHRCFCIAFTIGPPLPVLEEPRQLAESQRAVAVSLGVREEHFSVSEDEFQVLPAGGRVMVRGQLIENGL